MLVLAVTVAAPALSAAQDDAAPVTPPAPPAPAPPAPPATPDPAAEPADAAPQQVQVQSQAAPAPAATDRSAATEKPKTAKAAASKTVSIGDNFFTPATVTIDVGDTVTWKNNGAAAHTATADNGSFDTGQIPAGQSRSETFSTAGDIPYICTLHAGQSGTVKVLAASGGGGSGGGTSATTGPSEAAAVASPGAAGSSTSLPATGFVAIALFAIGFGLVGSGSYLKRLEQRLTSSAS
jgi:plastocyanin